MRRRTVKHLSIAAAGVVLVMLPVRPSLAQNHAGSGLAAESVPAAPGLTLPAATTAALASHPAIAVARQQALQAEARLEQAEAQRRFAPQFSSTAGVSNGVVVQPPPDRETFGSWVNSITVPLPIGKRAHAAVDQARAEYEAARAQLDSARLVLAGQTSTAYYDLLHKKALVAIALDALATAQRQLSDTQKRFAAGDVPDLDTLRAQVPVAAAQATLAQAKNDVTIAEQTLNALIGQPLDAPVALAAPTAPIAFPPLTLPQARDRALANSPDVRAAETLLVASRLGVRVAGLTREPIFSLSVSDTRSGDLTAFSRLDSLQATVTLPLSDGGLGKAQVAEANAALAQAQAQVEVARRSALTAVSSAFLEMQGAGAQIEATTQEEAIARTSYDRTVRGYQAGLFPLTDTLNAESAWTQARIAHAQALYDAAVALANLNHAMGALTQ